MLSCEELATIIEQATAPRKHDLPLLKLARFGELRSDRGSLRHDANVTECTGIEVDYDAGEIAFGDASDRLRKAGALGLRAIIYTTPSFTPERPRWRVLFPLSAPCPPARRAHLVGRANGLFGGSLGIESWALSQSYYYGQVIPQPEGDQPGCNPDYRVEFIVGVPLDLADDLDEIWLGKPNTKDSGGFTEGRVDEDALEQAIVGGESYHPSAVRLVGLWAHRGIPATDAEMRLRCLFDQVVPQKRDYRWQERLDDIPRTIAWVYAKEAAKPSVKPPPVRSADAADEAEHVGDDQAEIARLATLELLNYYRERKAAAKQLGCPVGILDNLVKAARGADTSGPGRPLDLTEPELWPQAVDGSVMLDELVETIERYVVLDRRATDATALWALATHAFDEFVIFPRLLVTAPEKGCGKSTLLDVLSRLAPRPLPASSITAAALFRTIEAAKPTLLLDEADTYARNNEDLRAVLDAGHRRDGAVIRTVGDDHEPRRFSAWAPVALAAIGRLPGTVEDRSIVIRLRRRRPDEAIESLRLDRAGRLASIARMAARWAADHAIALATADPAMPAALHNRAADNWRPLLAVADTVGGAWPERARRAPAELLSAGADEESSVRVALLADIRDAFAAKKADRLSSEDLVGYLVELDDRPWPEFKAGRPITQTQVARLLKPFGVSSGTIRFENGRTAKGYHRAKFEHAFVRYLPPLNDHRNVTTRRDSGWRSRCRTSHGCATVTRCDVRHLEIPRPRARRDA
jgi:hypothetical protein